MADVSQQTLANRTAAATTYHIQHMYYGSKRHDQRSSLRAMLMPALSGVAAAPSTVHEAIENGDSRRCQ